MNESWTKISTLMVAIVKYSHLKNSKLFSKTSSVKPVNLQVGQSVKSADELFIVVYIYFHFTFFPKGIPFLSWNHCSGPSDVRQGDWFLQTASSVNALVTVSTQGKYLRQILDEPQRDGYTCTVKDWFIHWCVEKSTRGFCLSDWCHILKIAGLQETLANLQGKISESLGRKMTLVFSDQLSVFNLM